MKYPIILVHGVMIKDFYKFRSFGKIEKILKNNNYKVFSANIDGLGSIENNAIQLKEFINKILKDLNINKVNLICHSKGGLDAKYMIENLDIKDNIASLTTLQTPFLGSPIASNILKMPKFIIYVVKTYFNIVYKIFGDKNPDSLKVCEQLKRNNDESMIKLNIDHNIYCQSFSSKMDNPKDDFIMGIPLMFSHFFEKEDSDGLVPKDSTKFENYKGHISEESISHTEMIDFFTKKKKKEMIYDFYLKICNDLKERGF